MPTRILLVGAGAIGAFYGARLACAPNTAVSALCRSNYKTVKANGFRVTSPKYGESTFKPEHTFANPAEARKAAINWDYLLVATKALPDVSDDSTLLEGLVGPETSIVLVQNGLGVEEPYQKRFPKTTIISAVTIASVAQPTHGYIQHNRWTRISIGPYLPYVDSDSAPANSDSDELAAQKHSRFLELLTAGGIPDAELHDHAGLQFVRWHKIAINAAMNPTSVLSGGSGNQEMSTDPELSRHLIGVMKEVLDTAPKVLGMPLPPKLATAEQILNSTKRNSSGGKPSMAMDWEKGQRMELEVILGNPIRLAREKDVEMPRLQSMYALLRKAQERREKAKGSKL